MSGAPRTTRDATEPASMATSKPSSSAIRHDKGSKTEAGDTQDVPARIARNCCRRLPQSTDCPLLIYRWFFGWAHGPIQPFAKAATHDPSFIVLAQPGEFFGKQGDHLPIRVTHPRHIGSPEYSLRPEGVEHLAQIAVQDGERIRLARIVCDRARLHSNVRALGQGEQLGQMGESLVVELGPDDTQMVDDKAQIRIARGNGVDQL